MKKSGVTVTPQEFDSLKPEWDRLALRHRLPTLSHAWIRASLSALDPGDTPLLIALKGRDGALRAGGALVKSPDTSYLRFLSSYALPEPAYVIADDAAAERDLFKALRRIGLPLELRRIPTTHFAPATLGRALGGAALRVLRSEGGSPYLPLAGSWDDFEAALPPNRRSDLRRAYRKAAALGTIEHEISASDSKTAPALLSRYIELERYSWKYDAGTAIEIDPKAHRFFQALTESPARLVFGFVRLNGVTVAAQIMLDFADTLWVLKTAFHNEYRGCSPGVILMNEAVKFGFHNGSQVFEFLGFEEPWLQVWSRGKREYQTLRLYTYSPQGVRELCRDAWLTLSRRFRNTVPALPAHS
jgi:CelD/BcsL family acetyltransferase involved in cellulose biosynthesis